MDQRPQQMDAGRERGAAKLSAPRARGEELVGEIAVTVLEIDELESLFLRQMGGASKAGNDGIDLGVGEDGAVIDDSRPHVEQRMAESHARGAAVCVRTRPATAVRELYADERLR